MIGTAYVALAFFQVVTYIPTKSAKYIGGTAAIPQNAVGTLRTSDQKTLSFDWGKSRKSDAEGWHVAYGQVTGLSYGQHAGRRVGAAIASAGTFIGAPAALPLLLVKKRRHYLTIEFLDDKGKKQGAIFLVGKNAIGPLLDDLETKTGKKVQYEDAEARQAREK
jgi:hypothetical protein